MSHPAAREFFRQVLLALRPYVPEEPRCIEIGSYIVNDSIRDTVRGVFPSNDYVGVDLMPGPGVDIVASGHEVKVPDGSFDLTLSSECLEHNPYWKETIYNMRRMTKPTGFVIISCATLGRLEHGTTRTNPKSSPGSQEKGWDYYRNLSSRDFPEEFLASFGGYRFWTNPYTKDLYFLGGVSSLPPLKEGEFTFQSIRPRSGLLRKLAVDLPLGILQRTLSEEMYQHAGVAYLRAGRPLKRLLPF